MIEPAKAEYARMAGRLDGLQGGEVLVIAPGDRASPPGCINPLEPASLEPGNPERTFPLQSHADLVRSLFLAAFHADEPFPQVLSRALTECYEANGWDLVTGEPLHRWEESGQPNARSDTGTFGVPRFPTLAHLQRRARRVVEEIGYGDDIKKNVRGFVDVRIGSLRLGTPGRLFEGGHPLDFAALLKRNVVVELESVTNDQDKAFVMGAVLIRLYEQLVLEEGERFARHGPADGFRHVTVIEEAHRLLRNVPSDSPVAHSLELFASLLAEVRAYGEGIVVAEQIPSKLIPDVIKNTALKVVHRLPSADDREAVGATMNLSDEQSAFVVTLDPGVAAVFADGMDRPVLIRMPYEEKRESAEQARYDPPLLAGARRSPSCGEECRGGRPCTLTGIRHAERLLAAHPGITLWMELAFAGHGFGYPAPVMLDGVVRSQLRATMASDPRLVQCAITHAAEAGLATRYDGLAPYFDPSALACHLTEVLTVLLKSGGGRLGCEADAGVWRYGSQRFADVHLGLSQLAKGEKPFVPREELIVRARRRGLALDGESTEGDLAMVGSIAANLVPVDYMKSLLFGDAEKPAVVQAAVRLVGPGAADAQVLAASERYLRWGSKSMIETISQRLAPPKEAAPA